MLRTLEVRCCCAPQKLLGWVDVEERAIRAGEIRVVVPRFTKTTAEWTEENEPMQMSSISAERLSFKIEEWWAEGRKQGLAVKAEGRTAAELMTLLRGYNFRSAEE